MNIYIYIYLLSCKKEKEQMWHSKAGKTHLDRWESWSWTSRRNWRSARDPRRHLEVRENFIFLKKKSSNSDRMAPRKMRGAVTKWRFYFYDFFGQYQKEQAISAAVEKLGKTR